MHTCFRPPDPRWPTCPCGPAGAGWEVRIPGSPEQKGPGQPAQGTRTGGTRSLELLSRRLCSPRAPGAQTVHSCEGWRDARHPHGRLPRGADPGPSFSPAPSSLRPVREHLGLRGARSPTHAGGGGKPQSPPPHAAAPVHCAGSQRPRGAWPAHAWQHSRTEQSLFQKPRAHPTAGGWGSQGTAGLSPRVYHMILDSVRKTGSLAGG